ncbi:hypothetical protein G7Y89_g2445 [Cudoniella acicularis]|uniref:Rhodopsin domain-containing protein n=1 Tax=Cudoniella acicularis TaxID=354080 RepID=A0A8H4RTB9_9HELO|nr:hypothetical protein G7Y89_g2445 [Cudoniella acicularis]
MSSYATPAGLIVLGALLPTLGLITTGLRFYTRKIQKAKLLCDDCRGEFQQPFAVAMLLRLLILAPPHYFGSSFDSGTSVLNFVTIATIVVTVLWGIAFFFANLFECGTHFSLNWNATITEALTECIQEPAMNQGYIYSDFILDVFILIMPLPTIWKLHMSPKRRIAVILILALGALQVSWLLLLDETANHSIVYTLQNDFLTSDMDMVAVLVLLSQSAYTGINIWLCNRGVGRHGWDLRLLEALPLLKPLGVVANITEPSIILTKLSLLPFYYRLFFPNLAVKLAVIIGMVFIFVCYTTLMFLFIFLQNQKSLQSTNKTMAVVNVLTDCYVLVLPIYSVVKLYLPKRKKIGLALIFATGVFAIVMSIVGAVFRFKFANDGTDFTWALLNVILVNQIECCVGIMCVCMPLFPAFLNNAYSISSDWMISMRSLRNRIFTRDGSRGSGSNGSTRQNKSSDRDDFVQLKPISASSSLNNGIGHPDGRIITKINAESRGRVHRDNGGIEVTTDYTTGRH